MISLLLRTYFAWRLAVSLCLSGSAALSTTRYLRHTLAALAFLLGLFCHLFAVHPLFFHSFAICYAGTLHAFSSTHTHTGTYKNAPWCSTEWTISLWLKEFSHIIISHHSNDFLDFLFSFLIQTNEMTQSWCLLSWWLVVFNIFTII